MEHKTCIGCGCKIVKTNDNKYTFSSVIIEAAFKAVGVTAVPVGYKGDLIIWTPQSIAYAKMEHSEFCKLNDAVETTIEQEVGVKVEQLLTEKAA